MSLSYYRRPVQRILLIQAIATLVFGMVAGIIAALPGLQAAGLAIVAYFVPYACSMRLTFKHQGAKAARQIIRGFYRGEALKIGLSVILFTLIFAFFKPLPWVFFSVYIGMQSTMWLVPLFVKQ